MSYINKYAQPFCIMRHALIHFRRIPTKVWMAFAFCFLATQVRGQVIVDSKIDRAEILVGEQCRITLSVTAGSHSRIGWPQYGKADTLMAGVEVLSEGNVDTALLDNGRRMTLSRNYLITSFDSALYNLRPMEVEVDGQAYPSRAKLGLKVVSVPVDTVHVDKFYPPFDVLESPFVWMSDILLTSLSVWLFLVLAIIGFMRLTSRRPMKKRVTIYPPVPPAKEALSALEKLKDLAASAVSHIEIKDYYVRLSGTLRTYFVRRFKFPSTEMTTGETLDELTSHVTDDIYRLCEEVITTADKVKFARYSANDVERRRHYTNAISVIQETLDTEMESPKPTIKYVEYSDKKQHRIRILIAILSCISIAAATGFFIWTIFRLWEAFF